MHTTNIDAKKAEVRRTDCLHCVVAEAVEVYYREHGKRVGEQVVIDVPEVCSKLAEAMVEVITMIPDRVNRCRAMRLAHDALDANLKSQMSGKLVEVEVPHEH